MKAFVVVRVGLGMVLLLAAGLKGYQLATQWADDALWQSAQVAGEWVLGVWLISGVWPRLVRWVAMSCFAVFFVVSLTKCVQGDACCGCFGMVEVSPWVTAVFNALAVLLLMITRPVEPVRSAALWWVGSTVILAAAGLVASGILYVRMPDLVDDAPPAHHSAIPEQTDEPTGQSVAPEPTIDAVQPLLHIDLGYVPLSSTHDVTYRFVNDADEPITITRYRSECICTTVTDQLPLMVSAGEAKAIHVQFKALAKPTTYARRIILQTEPRGVGSIVLHLSADIGLPLRISPSSDGQSIVIHNRGTKPVRLLYAVCEPLTVSVAVPRQAVAGGETVTLPIRREPQTKQAEVSTKIRITTDCATQPQLDCQI